STRAPHWRHGAVAFGPNGRRYGQRIPAKMRRAAFAEAFASRAAEGRVLVFDALPLSQEQPRTREVVEWLGRVGDTGSTILVTAEAEERAGRAIANARDCELRTPATLRLTDLLRCDTVLVARPALDALARRAHRESRS
ncbi:MAG: 50S ribosomal protein L4, partial [Candidatus Limnocylindria bacterium]